MAGKVGSVLCLLDATRRRKPRDRTSNESKGVRFGLRDLDPDVLLVKGGDSCVVASNSDFGNEFCVVGVVADTMLVPSQVCVNQSD